MLRGGRSAKRGLAALALGIGMLTLAPVASSFVALSSNSDRNAAEDRGTVIFKNAEMPAWIADIVASGTIETAHEDVSVIESTLL